MRHRLVRRSTAVRLALVTLAAVVLAPGLVAPPAHAAASLSGVITDSVTGKPVEDVLVRVWELVPDPSGWPRQVFIAGASTDAAGQYNAELPAGKYRIELSKDGYVHEFSGNTDDISSASDVDAPGTFDDAIIPAAELRGRVVDPGGAPAPGTRDPDKAKKYTLKAGANTLDEQKLLPKPTGVLEGKVVEKSTGLPIEGVCLEAWSRADPSKVCAGALRGSISLGKGKYYEVMVVSATTGMPVAYGKWGHLAKGKGTYTLPGVTPQPVKLYVQDDRDKKHWYGGSDESTAKVVDLKAGETVIDFTS